MPSVLTTLAAVGFAIIFGIPLGDRRLWWIAAIMLLVQFSISALNEWADRDLDARAGRRRPIPLGLLSARSAALIGVAFAGAALLLSLLSGFGPLAFAAVVVGVACGWTYDVKLKRTPLSFLPFAVAFPLIPLWTAIIAERPLQSLTLLLLGGVPIATAIHLADAIPDRGRDEAAGVRTLAVALGRPGGEIAAALLLGIGSLVAIAGIARRGAALTAVSLLGVAASYLVITLGERAPATAWGPVVGKWVLIAAAVIVAVALGLLASGA